MKKNLTIWIVGSNSSGKTTLARNIHNLFSEFYKEKIEYVSFKEIDSEKNIEKKCGYTKMNNFSSNLGKLDSAACGGTDTLNSKFQVRRSFEEASKVTPVVVIEGILATGQWIDFLKRENNIIMMILLDIDEDTNMERLKKRRAEKLGCSASDIKITHNTMKNVESKRNTHRSLFYRMEDFTDIRLNIPTQNYTQKQVFDKVKKKILEFLENN